MATHKELPLNLILFCFVLLFFFAFCDPVIPSGFPPDWHSWVLTTVKKGEQIVFNKGQIITSSSKLGNKYACRYQEEDLLQPSPARASDFCDFQSSTHFAIGFEGNCTIEKDISPSSPITFNSNITDVAKFFGVDIVNDKQCNHFYSQNVYNPKTTNLIDVNIWTTVLSGWPCQISFVDYSIGFSYHWAFDGFTDQLPVNVNFSLCSTAKQMCIQKDYVCHANPNSAPSQLGAALAWVCDPSHLDCSPIQPGGSNYLPNTLVDHCNWAFNAYYQKNKEIQGAEACYFGGAGELVPPTDYIVARDDFVEFDIPWLTLDLVC